MLIQVNGKNEETELFPIPKPIQSPNLPIPRPLPGVTPASTATLREVLKDNHQRWHCFFTDSGFHNHISHTVIALWSLGADADIIKAEYTYQCSYQRLAFNSPGPINKDNWTQHLGDNKYYSAYLAFFVGELAAKEPSAILEEYVFSKAANFPGGEYQVAMLARFHESLLHPLIHTGCGFELALPGLIAEGFSQAVVHGLVASPLVPTYWFENTTRAPQVDATSSVLSILSRVIADSEITFVQLPNDFDIYKIVAEKYGAKILEYVDAWTPDLSTEESLQKTLEEVVFFANLIYAVPGLVSEEEGTFNADFFTMHFVTSSVFLPTLLVHLKPRSQELLLRCYVTFGITWYIARGKAPLDVDAFFTNTFTLKSLLDGPTISRPCLPGIPAASSKSSNPSASVLEETLVHPDDHISKVQRTLLHFAQVYGQCEAGCFKNTELKGAEKIDGTLFMRSANLTAMRLNRAPSKKEFEGGVISWWDRMGFFPKA